MPSHIWGDENFDWNMLADAGHWIATFYRRLTGQNIIWKEKYGTIRYQYTSLWISNDQQASLFFEVVKRAAHKFWPVCAEIVDDAYCNCDDTYYTAYFEGILWGNANLNGLGMR